MVNRAELQDEVALILEAPPFSIPYTLKYYQTVYNAGSYDEAYLQASGNLVSGMAFILPLDRAEGGDDFKFLKQGLIQLNDSKMYIAGSMLLPDENLGAVKKVKVNVSGGRIFTIIDNGVVSVPSDETPIYRKCYLRLLNNGSFANEIE